MIGKKFDRQAAGKPIRVMTLTEIQEALEWLLNLSGSPPIDVQHGPTGPLIRLAVGDLFRDAFVTARVGPRVGNKVGAGKAKYCFLGGTDGLTLTSTNDGEFDVFNNTAGPIEVGTFGYVTSIFGKPRFVEADCMYLTNPGTPAEPTP